MSSQVQSALNSVVVAVRLRKRGMRPAPYGDGKRCTINLGVEDLPSQPRPESVPKFRTDDEVKVPANRRSNLRLSSSSDKEEISSFLMRESLRLEDSGRKRQMNSCWEEKENKLRERRKSLIVNQDDVDEMETPKPPPRRKRDARKRAQFYLCEPSGFNTSTTPEILSTPATPCTPDTPGTPGTPNTVSTVSLPGTPSSLDVFSGEEFSYPDMSATPDTSHGLTSTPDTLDSLSSPETSGRLSTRSLLVEDSPDMYISPRSRTMDNRIRRTSKNNTWQERGSTENILHSRNRQELRRSVSEYQEQDLGGSMNKAARRTNSDPKKALNKRGASIRDRIFRPNKNEGTSLSIPSRPFHRWSKKGSWKGRKQSNEDQVDDEGVVARVTHGSQGSAPSSPQLPSSRSASAESTPRKNILQRFKKGAKNSSKTSKGKTSRGADGCVEGGGEDGLSRSHSHENLYHSPGHASSPLQSRSRHKNQDETRRTENTLKIWIMEAKDIPSKKKYFCHLIVDLQPSHRTCSKPMTNMCFWGEYFELDLNPETTTICIELKREVDKKPHKRIGSVEIELKPSSPGRATLEEQWYPVKVDKQDKTSPALRIKHRFQSLDILPLSQYGPIRQYLKDNATALCQLLEPVLSVKAKEDIATTLINIMQAENNAITFLVDLVYTDIQTNAENEHLLFRGNSVATKAIEAYMKLVGEQYLHDTLQDPIQALITSSEDLEVDPLRITNIQSLAEQRNSLKEQVSAVWEKILQSSRNFPVELREVFHKLREQLSRQEKCELTDNLISSCVFLRFFCPAVLSPSLFNIATEYPDEHAGRNLTLVAKTLQTLANFTHFQGKERFMEFLNDFIDKEQERCRTFLKAISSPPSPEDSILEFDGKIDLGKHLALLHLHLADVLAEINTQGYESEASRVMALVDDISALLGGNHNGAPYVRRPSSDSHLTGSPALGPSQMHTNNNFTREECGDGIDEAGTGSGRPTSTNRSQSFPRSATPVYSQHHHMVSGSPRTQYPQHGRLPASDLVTSEEYVLTTAFDHSSRPQISMFLSEETNNNNNSPAVDVNNSNSYYVGELPPPALHQVHHLHHQHQPQRALVHTTQPRPHPRAAASRNYPMGGVPGVTDRRGFDGNCSDFFRYLDDISHKMNAVCKDGENNIQGSQTSISQLSNIGSSGYQSFAYSQSSSPVDSLLHTDNSSLLSRENGNPGLPVGMRQVLQDSPLDLSTHNDDDDDDDDLSRNTVAILSCDREREDFRGSSHRFDDSEDDLNVAAGSLGGAGAGGWARESWQEHHHLLGHSLAPQQLLDQQEDQMRAIIERLMSMEQEFRHEQEMMRREMYNKDARIDAQEKKIAALDTANSHLIRTIASLNPRPGEMKPDLTGDLHNDSCNASDTSDYKSSSC